MPDPDDTALVDRFLETREEVAFLALYRQHTPRMWALAMRLTGRRSAAEELTQTAWVRAVEGLERFEGRSTFTTWLGGILINCHRERARRRGRWPRALEEPDREAAAPIVRFPTRPGPAEWIDVERALARLPDGYREVVVLHDVEGHTHREIGALLGIDPGTSKSQLARGRARLRALLEAGEAARPQGRGRP